MKLSTEVIIVFSSLVFIIVLNSFGFNIIALLTLGIPVAFFIYILILAKRYVDLKMLESNTNLDLKTRIEMLNESVKRIEKKVDNIENMLEKVSE